MTGKRTIKVLVGTREIAGYYRNLSKGLRLLGVNCDYITYATHPFGYGGETQQPLLLKVAKWINQFRGKPNLSIPVRVVYALLGEIITALWAVTAMLTYDVFIFAFGCTLLRNNYDLPILRLMGKKVISNLSHGSDARPPFIDGAHQAKNGLLPALSLIKLRTSINRNLVNKHFRYASIVIGSPFSTSQFANDRFINGFLIGIPFQEEDSPKPISQTGTSTADNIVTHPVRILHSPSHPAAKGSPIIIQAIERLKERGYVIDFILIREVPYKEVLKEIQQCDFVVDQVYSDTPMAGFATESAWFAKPAVVGGYGLDRMKQFVPECMCPPSKTCHPDQIEQAIEDLIVDIEQRERLGREAQAFVREKWNVVDVARRYLQLIEGDIPDCWWIDPKDVIYCEGCGQSVELTKQTIRELVAEYGVESLQLSHRSDLQAAFLKFAQIDSQLNHPNAYSVS